MCSYSYSKQLFVNCYLFSFFSFPFSLFQSEKDEMFWNMNHIHNQRYNANMQNINEKDEWLALNINCEFIARASRIPYKKPAEARAWNENFLWNLTYKIADCFGIISTFHIFCSVIREYCPAFSHYFSKHISICWKNEKRL